MYRNLPYIEKLRDVMAKSSHNNSGFVPMFHSLPEAERSHALTRTLAVSVYVSSRSRAYRYYASAMRHDKLPC